MLSYFNLNHTCAGGFLTAFKNLWEFAPCLNKFVWQTGASLGGDFIKLTDGVWVHKNCEIAPSAYITAPTIIFEGASIRHCAYIRGGAIIGRGCVVGNSCEVKNSILFDEVKIPHFNYVGDSILGYRAHFGAGVKTGNVKSDGGEIYVTCASGRVNARLKKLGAFVGDGCEIGCNAVLNPAAVLGNDCRVYPLCSVRGFLPPRSILKSGGEITLRE